MGQTDEQLHKTYEYDMRSCLSCYLNSSCRCACTHLLVFARHVFNKPASGLTVIVRLHYITSQPQTHTSNIVCDSAHTIFRAYFAFIDIITY